MASSQIMPLLYLQTAMNAYLTQNESQNLDDNSLEGSILASWISSPTLFFDLFSFGHRTPFCCSNIPGILPFTSFAIVLTLPRHSSLEKVSFHSNPKERKCQRMLKLPHNYTDLTC